MKIATEKVEAMGLDGEAGRRSDFVQRLVEPGLCLVVECEVGDITAR